MLKFLKYGLGLSILLFASLSFSQELTKEEIIAEIKRTTGKHLCATPDMTKEHNESSLKNSASLSRTPGFTQLPIRIHIVTLDNGTGGISLSNINEAVANLNYVYQSNNMEWYIADVNYIASTMYYDFSSSDENALCSPHEVDDAVNVFFVNSIAVSGGGACGYARYPSNSDVTLRILMANGCTVGSVNGTFVHEFGHFFNLAHTHNGTSSGNGSPNAEHVPRTGANSNCLTDGDYLCDTEADPTGSTSNCVYTGGGTDIHGNDYTPDVDNIMSYYPDGCGGIFTPQQYIRILGGLATRLAHTAYDLDGAQPLANADPSGLNASVLGTTVTLNWTDNASDELGYLIERSSDGTDYDPIPFGGVAPNVTTFSDSGLLSNTTYWYRVKASSDDPDDYSPAISVTTDLTNYVCSDALILESCGTFPAVGPNQGNGATHGDAAHAVWYEFIPPYSGTMDIFSCLGGTDTRLWLYTDGCGSLTPLNNNDDACEMTPGGTNLWASRLLGVPVTKDVAILIEWDSRWSTSAFTFTIEITATDACPDAKVISSAGTHTVHNITCGDAASHASATHSSWFKFTPPTTGDITIRSCAQGVDTRLWVYSGTCASLVLEGTSDNDCNAGSGLGNVASNLTDLAVVAGSDIWIEWDDKWSSQGFDFEILYQGNCPSDYTLTGTQNVSTDFETDGIITSSQIIGNGAVVDYDSASSITLEANFETIVGAIFQAIIDGCGGTQ